MIPVDEQILIFIYTIGVGLVIGLIFDLYRILRWVLNPRKVLTILGDALIWCILTGIVFFLLLMSNWGEIRFYVFIGMAAGVAFYIKFLSCRIIFLLKHLANILHKPFGLFFRIIALPWRFLKILLGFPTFVFIFSHRIGRKLHKK